VREASLLVASQCTGTYPDYERFILLRTLAAGFMQLLLPRCVGAITKAWSLIVETKYAEIDFITCSDTAGSLFKTTLKRPTKRGWHLPLNGIMPHRNRVLRVPVTPGI